jgi:hypothetical protein
MKKIFSSDDPIQCGFLKGALDNLGIACVVRNELLAGGLGEISFLETWPELWVLADDDERAACRAIAELLEEHTGDGEDWECGGCGQQNEPQFTACWKCGVDRQP